MRLNLNKLILWTSLIGITLLALVCGGCSATPESVIQSTIDNVIRYDTIRVTLPQDVRYDTVYLNNGAGESIKYIVRVDTHKVFIKSKEKIVYVPVVDTVTVTRTEVKTVESNDFFRGVTLMAVLYVIGGVALLGFLGRMFGK